VLITYQWTGVLPWSFTIDIHGVWDWLVPLAIVMLGTRLNILFTGRVPSIVSWISSFVLLGVVRSWFLNTPLWADLVVLTGIPMVLFTFYMITDPQTSPSRLRSQIFFGAAIAFTYHALLLLHVQYMMFYSVTIVCAARGLCLFLVSVRSPVPEPAAVLVARPQTGSIIR
jgi:Na+-translocating ferredoxin:NAD+ oxidoreductase RnfD subunit